MILNFSFGNYKSFKDLQQLKLGQASQSAKISRLNLVYGANASGKSNILKALIYIQRAVQARDPIQSLVIKDQNLECFLLNKKNRNLPILFELTLLTADNSVYRYGFAVDQKNGRIDSEWLFEAAKRGSRITKRKLFTRQKDKFEFGTESRKLLRGSDKNIPSNILAIQKFAEQNHPGSLKTLDLIVNKLILFNAVDSQDIASRAYQRYQDDQAMFEQAKKIILDLDIAVRDFNIARRRLVDEEIEQFLDSISVKIPPASKNIKIDINQVSTTHNLYNDSGKIVGSQAFDFNRHESLGTQNLVHFLAMVLDVMKDGLIVMVDEFGSGWHPFISAYLIKLLNTSKKNRGQFIFLTHETYLLKPHCSPQKNQIWFVEKDRREQSNLIGLSEYKPRGDATYDKQYLEGRFGGVPSVVDTEG